MVFSPQRRAHFYKRRFSKHWVRAGLRDPYRTEWCFHVVQHVWFYGYYNLFASRLNVVPIFARHFQDDSQDRKSGLLEAPWLPQAPKCNSYIITYILKLLLFGGSVFLNSWSSGPLAAPSPKMQFLHNNLHLKIAAFGGPDFVEFLVPWAPGCSRPQNVLLT